MQIRLKTGTKGKPIQIGSNSFTQFTSEEFFEQHLNDF